MLWASRAPSYPARMSRRRRATARPQKRLPTIYSSKSPWSSLLATTSRARDASGDHRRTVSLHAFDPRDRVLAAHQLHREPDLVTGFELLEHSGIPGLEHHRHRRHAEVRDGTVLQRDPARFPVDLADLSLGKRGPRRGCLSLDEVMRGMLVRVLGERRADVDNVPTIPATIIAYRIRILL